MKTNDILIDSNVGDGPELKVVFKSIIAAVIFGIIGACSIYMFIYVLLSIL